MWFSFSSTSVTVLLLSFPVISFHLRFHVIQAICFKAFTSVFVGMQSTVPKPGASGRVYSVKASLSSSSSHAPAGPPALHQGVHMARAGLDPWIPCQAEQEDGTGELLWENRTWVNLWDWKSLPVVWNSSEYIVVSSRLDVCVSLRMSKISSLCPITQPLLSGDFQPVDVIITGQLPYWYMKHNPGWDILTDLCFFAYNTCCFFVLCHYTVY